MVKHDRKWAKGFVFSIHCMVTDGTDAVPDFHLLPSVSFLLPSAFWSDLASD